MSGAFHVGEHESEPVRGLPEALPAGERVLWQGSPSAAGLARRVFHVRKVAIYFALLVGWSLLAGLSGERSTAEIALTAARLGVLGAVAAGILGLFGWLHGRTTIYTITNRRIVVRYGIAITLAVNLPFRKIESASLNGFADGTGDIALSVSGGERFGFLMLWPHVRPWRFGAEIEPTLRAVPDARAVAEVLARALADSAGQTARTASGPVDRARDAARDEAPHPGRALPAAS